MPVVINSRFTPLTYDEITKPLIQQTEAQQAMEEAYAEVSDKASEMMARANQQTDPIAYNKLRAYSEDLQKQADALMSRGLQSGSRRALLDMRRRYGQEITPIKQAADRKEALAEEQRQLRLKNPNMLFQRDMRSVSLDEMLSNPQLDYGSTIDLDSVTKQAAAITSAFKTASLSLGKNLDRYTQQIIQQSGLTPEEIQAAINGDGSMLDKALQNLYTSTGVHTWGDRNTEDRVNSAIWQGAMMGQGSVDIKTQANRVAMRQDELSDRRAEWQRQDELYGIERDAQGNIVSYNPEAPKAKKTTSVTTSEGNNIEVDAGSYSSKYKSTIYKSANGTYYMRDSKKGFIKIGDQEDAAKEYQGGDKTKAVKASDAQKRINWSAHHPHGVVARRISSGENGVNLDDPTDAITDISTNSELVEGTSYASLGNDVIKIVDSMLKDSGYNIQDVYVLVNRRGRDKVVVIPKDQIDNIPSQTLKTKIESKFSSNEKSDSGSVSQSQPDTQVPDTAGITAVNKLFGMKN